MLPEAAVAMSTPTRQPTLRVVHGEAGSPSAWQLNFEALRAFAHRNGHCHVPYRDDVEGRNLYAWAARQRARRSQLSQSRQDQLESLPGWSWNFRKTAWESSYNVLTQFVEREGHCRVPRSHMEDGIAIGRWVSAQRQRLHRLDPARRNLLESLPGWTPEARSQHWWDCRASVLLYAEQYGHSRVPHGHVYDGRNLGLWVARQRWLRRQDRLSASRVSALESIPGWSWNPGDESRSENAGARW